jgi:hypothetical protein
MVGYRNSKCTQLEEHQHQKGPSVVVFGFVFSSTSFDVSVACGGLPSESSNDFRRIHRYNSAFFSSLATNDYNIVYATENFVTGAPFDAEAIGATWLPPGYDVTPVQEQIASYELVIIASNSSTDGGSLLGSDSYELSSPGTGWAPYDWFVRFCYPDLGLISHSH